MGLIGEFPEKVRGGGRARKPAAGDKITGATIVNQG